MGSAPPEDRPPSAAADLPGGGSGAPPTTWTARTTGAAADAARRAVWGDLGRPPLRAEALRGALVAPAGPLGALDVVAELPSTSTELAARVRAADAAGVAGPPDLAVLVAEHQSAGRGRRGRTFTTPPRGALTLSVLLRTPPAAAGLLTWLPLLGGLAVVQVLRRHAGLQAVLKWPNDVLVPLAGGDGEPGSTGKVCGLLAEVVPPARGVPGDAGPVVVLGVGLDVDLRRDELPAEGVTSLRLAGAATTDRDVLLRALLRRLADLRGSWDSVASPGAPDPAALAALTDPVREVCSTLGEPVRVTLPGDEVVEGVAEELDADGALVVRTADGLRTVTAGDVVHVRPGATS